MNTADGFTLRCPSCRGNVFITRETVGQQFNCPLCRSNLVALWHPSEGVAALHSVEQAIQKPTIRIPRSIPFLWVNIAIIPLSFLVLGWIIGLIVLVLVLAWFAYWWKLEVKNRILNIMEIVAHRYTEARRNGDGVLEAEIQVYADFQIEVIEFHSSIPWPAPTPAQFDLIVLANTAGTVMRHLQLWNVAGKQWPPGRVYEIVCLISSRIAYYGFVEQLKGNTLPDDFVMVATQDGEKSEPGW